MRDKLFDTSISRLLGIRHPILCGGLGPGVSDGAYVAAVINAGGMGFIVSVGYDAEDDFERELKLCRDRIGDKPMGVNLYISRLAGGVQRVIDRLPLLAKYGVTCVETAGASPAEVIPILKEMGITVIHKVPALKYISTAERVGADAVIVVGQECGGHPGIFMIGSMVQAAQAPFATELPTIAAGGFGTGRQLVAALAMGNGAMLMGSRMMVAEELWIDRKFKEFVARSDGTESVVVKKILRDNHRILNNESAKAALELEARGVTEYPPYLKYLSGKITRKGYREGDPQHGSFDWGQSILFANQIRPVEGIFDEIIDDAAKALGRLESVTVRQVAVQ